VKLVEIEEVKEWEVEKNIKQKKSEGSCYVLQSMPPGVNMDMGKGYDDNDWLRWSSLSQRLM